MDALTGTVEFTSTRRLVPQAQFIISRMLFTVMWQTEAVADSSVQNVEATGMLWLADSLALSSADDFPTCSRKQCPPNVSWSSRLLIGAMSHGEEHRGPSNSLYRASSVNKRLDSLIDVIVPRTTRANSRSSYPSLTRSSSICRNSTRRILPLTVLGSSVTNSTERGYL